MLTPLGKRILIQPITIEKKSSIILVKEDIPQAHKVIAIGDEVTKVNVGNAIFIAPYSTSEIKYNDEKYQIILEENILAKIDN